MRNNKLMRPPDKHPGLPRTLPLKLTSLPPRLREKRTLPSTEKPNGRESRTLKLPTELPTKPTKLLVPLLEKLTLPRKLPTPNTGRTEPPIRNW